eukprot:Plantae.Rhodophyta-Hildenbrandia_rubra.ctg17878.p1 GENE.Plantae.Rhodophyta-Hildenbrandia_rubra.ctg17878~~Plantae.Rhodophyta-Hildenbrandia_rubra.ctg17878.p1  ORF type:complete len:369 (-),score=46.22 Plantae.Rhodophyta-Hildenbrandia_rubra.ctg17878:482-1588(-)
MATNYTTSSNKLDRGSTCRQTDDYEFQSEHDSGGTDETKITLQKRLSDNSISPSTHHSFTKSGESTSLVDGIVEQIESKMMLEQNDRPRSASNDAASENEGPCSQTDLVEETSKVSSCTGSTHCSCMETNRSYARAKGGLQAQLNEAIADADRLSKINERQRGYLTEQRLKMSDMAIELQTLRNKNSSLIGKIKFSEQQARKDPTESTPKRMQSSPSHRQLEGVGIIEQDLRLATEQNQMLKEKSMAMAAANIQVSEEVNRLNRTIYLMNRRISHPNHPAQNRFGFRPSITPEGQRRRPLPMTSVDRRPSMSRLSPVSPVSDTSSSSIPTISMLQRLKKNTKLRMRRTPPKGKVYHSQQLPRKRAQST